MKRIILWLVTIGFCGALVGRAQDAAVEERLNKLSGQIEDLLAAKAEQDKRISALVKEIEGLREQVGKPTGNYANADEVRRLADSLKEVDRNRVADNERIVKQIENIGKVAANAARTESHPAPPRNNGESSGSTRTATTAPRSGNESGYEYVIAPGDTFSTIAEAYRLKGVKTSAEQIQKANPEVKAKSLRVGQKIFIPAQ